MNEKFIADDIIVDNIFSLEALKNHSYVQFYHRILAYLILILFLALYFNNIKNKYIPMKYFNFIFLAVFISNSFGNFDFIIWLKYFFS